MSTAPRQPRIKIVEASSPSGLAELIAIATKAKPEAGELRTAMVAAHDEVDAAQREHDDAEHAYRAGLLSLDQSALAGLISTKAEAVIRRDRASALIEALEARLVEQDASEAEAKRRAAYSNARASAAAASKAILRDYPNLARGLRDLIRTIAEAERDVANVNADLPAGAEPLVSPEHAVRSDLALPKKVLSETVVQLWCHPNTWDPILEKFQDQVRRDPANGLGYFSMRPDRLGQTTLDRLVLRQFLRRKFLPATWTTWADELATVISLPGLHGMDEPFWHPLWGNGYPGLNHDQVLRMLPETEIDGDTRIDPEDDDRDPEIELVPVADVLEEAA